MAHCEVKVAFPWLSNKHTHISLYGHVIPVVHAASIIGLDKNNLIKMCNDYKISWAPRPAASKFDLHLSLESFQQLLIRLQWPQEKMAVGMTQLFEAANRKQQAAAVEEVIPAVSNNNNRKRAAPSPEEEEEEEGSMPVWGAHLIRSVRKDAIAAYWKSDEWQRQKDVLIQARLDAMEPYIRAGLEKKLEEEMREKRKKSEPTIPVIVINDGAEEEASNFMGRYIK